MAGLCAGAIGAVSPVITAHRVTIVAILRWLASIGWSIYNRWYQGATTGQSLGNKALNLKLVSEQTGQPIGVLKYFVRDI